MGVAEQWWRSCLSGGNVENEKQSDRGKLSGWCWLSWHRRKWGHSDQSMMGKDTISAGEQHASPDHLGHYAAHWPYVHWRWTFRWQGGGHANKMVRLKKAQTRWENASRMAAVWWKLRTCRISQINERGREQCSVEQIICLQPMTARTLLTRHVTLGYIKKSPLPATKYCIEAKNWPGKDLTVCTARRTNTSQRLLRWTAWRRI